jgi:hypothetical protein
MTRIRMAIAAAFCLTAATVHAQGTHFTVSAASVSVYKAPTNVSPVIGEARQGATLEVTRDVGGWVKVAWAKAPDGVGYIRKSAGTMGAVGPTVPAAAASTPAASAPAAARTASAPRAGAATRATPVPPTATASTPSAPAAPAPAAAAASVQTGPSARIPLPTPAGYVTPSHRFGVGGQIGGSAVGAGFSLRGWSKSQKIGIQFDVTHSSMTNDVFFTSLSSTQVGPRVLYAFRDRVSDRIWVRPYLGAGAHMLRASVNDPVTGLSQSDTGVAAQFFGGAEITLSAAPRLGLSAEAGHQWHQSPFVGYTLDGMMMTLSAHWYIK